MKNLTLCAWLFVSGCWLPIFSQQKNLFLNREWALEVEKWNGNCKKGKDTIQYYLDHYKNLDTTYLTSCFKPYYENFGQFIQYSYRSFTSEDFYPAVKKKLFDESLFVIKDSAGKFHMTIDPLFNFEYGRGRQDSTKETLYKNTRGVLVRGDIGSKFSFESSFSENQATFVKYIDDYIKGTDTLFPNTVYYPYRVVPGQGRAKAFKKSGYDFAMASGYISYSPSHHFNFQIGTGKHFVGDGYRSLLLSDNSFNYPFLRITSYFGKFQYTNLYASFMNLTDGGVKTPPSTERLFQKKAASFQFLSWNPHKRIQLGFFQGMIWRAADSANKIYLNASYFNPVIFAAAAEFGLDHSVNVLLGSTLKIKIANTAAIYGQFMADDLREKNPKTGFQAGAKYFDAFNLKNLHLQLEYNQVQPYSYSSSNPSQSYTHYNQSLTHPLGANFKEGILFINYRIGDFFTELKYIYAVSGINDVNNNGNNVFISDTVNIPSNPVFIQRTLQMWDMHVGYVVNPSTNFNIVFGMSNRLVTYDTFSNKTDFFYLGIRTSLSNFYYDF